MSEQHASRLRLLRLEMQAAQEALDSACQAADRDPAAYRSDPADLRRASRECEDTYYIRLIAELEGMLFRHLRDHFSSFVFAESDGATALVNHTRSRLDPRNARAGFPEALANEVLEAVAWRNFVAHGRRGQPPPRVPYNEAFGRIRDFVLKLPPMKGAHDA